MGGHDHEHEHHDHHEHDHDHEHEHHGHEEEDAPDMSGWLAGAQTSTCPACGAAGALTLGGGLFCPTCGEITTSPGYQAPPAAARDAEPDPD